MYGANPEQELCHISEHTRKLFELPPSGNVSTEKFARKVLAGLQKELPKHPENNIKIEALKQIIALLYAPPKPLKLPPPKSTSALPSELSPKIRPDFIGVKLKPGSAKEGRNEYPSSRRVWRY